MAISMGMVSITACAVLPGARCCGGSKSGVRAVVICTCVKVGACR